MASAGSRPVPARKVNSTWLGPNSTSMRAQRQAEIDDVGAQDLQDRVHLVVALLGQVLVALVQQRHVGRLAGLAGVGRIAEAELALLQLEEMELDFEAGDEIVAAVAQRLERAAVDVARAERHRPAVGKMDVAQHPAGMRRPRQHAEGRGIGQHHHVGRALELLHAEAAARLPDREHRAVRGVLQQHRRGEADAVLQRRVDLARRQRSCRAARRAGRRRPAARPTARPPGCGAPPRASPSCGRRSTGPRARPGSRRAYATSGGMVLAAQLEPLRRRASKSFQ